MKNFLLLLLFTVSFTTLDAQAVSWELSAEPGDQANSAGTNLSSNFTNNGLSRGAGVSATTGAGSMNSSGWFSGSSATTLADAIANNDYYEFTVNNINCQFFNPTTINIVMRSSASGPNTATLRCSSDGFTTNIGTVAITTTSAVKVFSESISPNSSTITYRLYGYGAAAGGGTPAAGGTMRIGTSVVAGDNDIELFAFSTILSVAQVSNITVTDGDAVPLTALVANVPGATVSWSRTPETIGLVPTNGTGDILAFNAFNASGVPVTSTFTVSATLGACTSVNMTFTITVNPAPCTITVDFFGNPGPCNDNGTPNDPSDDFFTQNIHASFFNRPSTGSLQIVPGGDQIGTYSIPVNQIIGNSHLFTAVQLRADGTPSIVQMNFTDNPGCIDADTGPTVQPCSVPPPPCTITVDFFGNPGPCNDNGTPNDPSDDFFTQNIHASFFNRPSTGSLQIVPGGDQIGTYSIPVNQIIGNSHLFSAVQLRADGTPSIVQMNFTDNPGCIDSDTGPAVQSCSGSGGFCELIGYSFTNIDPCNDNGTGSDAGDDFFTVDVEVLFTNTFSNSRLWLLGPDVVTPVNVAAPIGTNISHTFTNVKLRATGNITNFVGDIESTIAVIVHCSLPGTGPAVNSCSSGGGACDITDVTLLNIQPCDDNGTSDPSDDFFTASVKISYVNPPNTGFLQIEPGGDAIGTYSIPASNLPGSTSTTFSNVHFKADGTVTVVEAEFTIPANQCVLTITGPTVDPCSYLPPVLTCPAPVLATCASEVPAVNLSSVSETHTCPGSVTITHLGDVTSNNICANRFTITRTYQGADNCAQTATCAQIITVNDQTPPLITFCPPHLTVSCANNVPPADPNGVIASDNCGGAVAKSTQFDGISGQTCPNRFQVSRIYAATDVCGNTGTCSQIISVNDQTKPTMTCPGPVTVSCASNVPAANINLVTGVGDNCGGAVNVFNFPSDAISNQTCVNRFTITRSYFAVDVCGNSNNCLQTIVVNDQTPPTLTCPAPVNVSCAEQVPVVNPATVTGLGDNCGGTVTPSFFSQITSNQTCVNRFTLTRQYRAADACGNTASCTQVITVNDVTPPTFTFVPPNLTVECYLVPGIGTPTAADNCNSGATVAFLGETVVTGVCPIAFIHTRTWRATDACGNSSTVSQQIFVTDTHAPQFLALPKDRIKECGPDNQAEFQAFLDDFGGAIVEDCTEITYSHEDSPVQNIYFDCGNTFHKNIRFIATDRCGNSSFRDASFTVVDLTPPVFSTLPQNVDFECDGPNGDPETAFYDWVDSFAGLVAEDACGEVTLEKVLVSEAQTCVNTWRKTYEFRAYDQCGNLNKQKATFSVVDHTPPSLICPPNTNTYYACQEDVPIPDLAALTAWDCSGVTLTHQTTFTDGTGCPGWPMTIVYRYSAVDGCNNVAVCDQTFYVRETNTPTLACPDTIKLVCVDDIPGPLLLFDYVKALLASDCAGGFTSIKILSDSGQPQNGATHRTYTITAKNHCGLVTSACNITFKATGICRELCTASQQSWGSPNGTIGGSNTADVVNQLIQSYGPITVGGGANTLTAADAACVQELLFGAGGTDTQIPTGHHTCPLPSNMMNANGALESQIAANAIALQLNIWYNLKFNDRNLGVQDLNNLPPCLVELALLKELAQHSTIQDVLNLANDYMQGYHAFYGPNMPALLNAALDNLNFFRVDCGLNAPCERPNIRNAESNPGFQHAMRLFPNPATDRVNLEFWAAADGEVCLKMAGARGMISEKTFQASKGLNTMPLSLNQFPAGVYWVTLRNGDQIETLRLVKMGN